LSELAQELSRFTYYVVVARFPAFCPRI